MSKIKGLYGITSNDTENIEAQVEAALVGGAKVIQFRNKSSNTEDSVQLGKKIAELCRKFGSTFIVNDNVELVLALDADGIHLGKNDTTIEIAREKIGNKIIGVSCYNNLNLAIDAEKRGANYVAFGRFFPSLTKPNAVEADVKLLKNARQQLSIPIVAIGGITLDNAAILIRAGVDSIAVINGLFNQTHIKDTAQKFSHLF